MTITVVYANEAIKPEQLIVEIYGEPGVGKSSIGFSAHSPLTLDFDQGAHRSEFRKDIVRISRWEDTSVITPEDLADYSTVVVDTVGRALDMLTASLIKTNVKLATAQGGLTMSGYGALKSSFISWLNQLRTLGLDVVLLSHMKEDRKANDTIFYRPDITGGSASEIYKVADLIGFYHMRDGVRTIEFAPTDAWAAKDPSAIGTQRIPDLKGDSEWLGRVIADAKEKLGNISQESQEIAVTVTELIEKIKKAKTPAAINKLYDHLREVPKVINQQCKGTLQYRCKDLKLVFDREKMKFVKAPKEKEAPASEPADAEDAAKASTAEASATKTEAAEGQADPLRDGKD